MALTGESIRPFGGAIDPDFCEGLGGPAGIRTPDLSPG